jgi:acetyl-CoA acetyltransferase
MTRCGPCSADSTAHWPGVRPDDLASYVIKALLERHPYLDGGAIDEVIFGNANGAGEDHRNLGRMAAYWPGFR